MPVQENVMNESVAMVPDAKQRLKLAVKDLNTFMVRVCCQRFLDCFTAIGT
jgi:hypothetical protein